MTYNGQRFFPVRDPAPRDAFAIATGETRPPRKGEWYLSGAIVEAYRAPNDLTQPFPIARLAHVTHRLEHRYLLDDGSEVRPAAR